MDRTTGYFDLLEALPEEGCPVCRLGLIAVHRYIEAVNYESVGDPGIREQLRASSGFCNVHAYQWLRQAHVLGTAAIYVDVLSKIVDELRELPFQAQTFLGGVADLLGVSNRHGNGNDRLAPHGTCPVCRVLAETEQMLMRTLLAVLPLPAFQDAYRSSFGLCLPHLRRTLATAEDEATFAILRDVAIAREELLLSQLHEIIRHHDYRFMAEPVGAERGAAERAIQHVVGGRSATSTEAHDTRS